MKKLPIRNFLRSALGTALPAAAILVVGCLLLTGAYALLPRHIDDYKEYSIDPTAAQEQSFDLTLYPWNELTVPYEGVFNSQDVQDLMSGFSIPFYALNLEQAKYLINRSQTILGIRNIQYLPYAPHLTEYTLSIAIRNDEVTAGLCYLRAERKQDGGSNEPSEAAVQHGYKQLCELAEHPLDTEDSVFFSFAQWLSGYTGSRLTDMVYELLYKGANSYFLYQNEVYFSYVGDKLSMTLIADAASGVLTGFSLEWK